jgi:acyl transferase domain-containing protein
MPLNILTFLFDLFRFTEGVCTTIIVVTLFTLISVSLISSPDHPQQTYASLFDLFRFTEGVSDEADAALLKDPCAVQLCIFAVEYATARVLIAYGVKPTALAGHSIGE